MAGVWAGSSPKTTAPKRTATMMSTTLTIGIECEMGASW